MVPTLMGASVFSVGFFMLILGLADLLRLGGLNFGTGERILIYIGGIFLCILGYFMARRPRSLFPPEEYVAPPANVAPGVILPPGAMLPPATDQTTTTREEF